MTFRMSVPGPVDLIARSYQKAWRKYGGTRIPPRPTSLTYEDNSGLINQFLILLRQQPLGRMPRTEADVILAQKVDTSAPCPKCGGPVGYWDSATSDWTEFGWSPLTGLARNGGPCILRKKKDRPAGIIVRCRNCKFKCPPWSTGGVRPRLRFALDLELVVSISGLGKIVTEDDSGRQRLVLDDTAEWYSITKLGIEFNQAIVEGRPRDALAIIRNALRRWNQSAEALPKPEVVTPGSVQNTLQASLTEGPAFRDYAVFVASIGNASKSEDRIFHLYYGRDFALDCKGCKMRTLGCPLRNALANFGGESVDDGGCLPNLIRMVELNRRGVVKWKNYSLEVRGESKSGFQKLVTGNRGPPLGKMEWTHQIDKETSLLRFVSKGVGWITIRGDRATPANTPKVQSPTVPPASGPVNLGGRWSPHPRSSAVLKALIR